MDFLISGTHIPPTYLIGIGFVIGVLGGFFGVGGSFLAGPALFAFGVPMNFVVGTDLAHIVGKSIVAAKRHRALGNVDIKLGLIMVIGTIAGVEAGAQGIEWLKEQANVDRVVAIAFLVVLMSISGFMAWETWQTMKLRRQHAARSPGGASASLERKKDESAIAMNNNSTIQFGGMDRITQTGHSVVSAHGTTVQRTTTAVWLTLNTDSSDVVSTVDTSTDGLQSWTINFGVANQSQTVYTRSTPSRTVTATAPDGSQTVSSYQNGRLTSSISTAGALTLGSQSFTYDPHGRLAIATDNRTGTQTTNSYDNADEVLSTTVIPPGLPVQATSYQYDTMGRQILTTLPDYGTVSSAYYSTGELATNSGARTYPVAFGYDYAGRMKTMTTWQNYAGNTGSATTTWNYDSLRGFLISKAYADNSSVTYSNSAAGKLLKRTWARTIGGQPLATTYAYNPAGDWGTITYSDGTTPNVNFGFDRQGRKTSVTDGTGTHALTYNDASELLTESFPNSGAVVTNSYDSLLRRSSLGGIGVSPVQLSYDAASRLNAVTNGTYTAGYTYLPNSSLVSNVVFATSGVTKMTTAKSYDNLNRLTSINSSAGASNVSSFAYQYNTANQRTQATLADGSYWMYMYDSLGQVTGGQKYWPDGSPVTGEQFGYDFDEIGNRESSVVNGQSSVYIANNLNQYTQRTVPGDVWELGGATNNATVTVNNEPTGRKGDYFWRELTAGNASTPVYTQLTTVAALKNGGTGDTNQLDIVTTKTGHEFVPKTPEAFSFDADGNLLSDGRWTNMTWDAENRLISMETSVSAVTAGAPKQKLLFGYDYMGRRISKVVSNWTGDSWVRTNDIRFVYDGWNVIGELTNANLLARSYTWGLDLSGSIQGAGGIGGLMMVTQNTAQPTNHFVAFDGNGNVTALLNADSGSLTATYEYGPFGEVIRSTGPMAKVNPFRFSTKYQDDESDLLYYGYRYYNPSTGRWLSRDPAEESGAKCLYAFVENAPINYFDDTGNTSSKSPSGNWGPDITTALNQTLEKVASRYNKLTKPEKLCQCKALLPHTYSSPEWDIDYVNQGYRYPEIGGVNGTGAFIRTAVFNSKCYYSTEINYALWGKANSLCMQSFGWVCSATT